MAKRERSNERLNSYSSDAPSSRSFREQQGSTIQRLPPKPYKASRYPSNHTNRNRSHSHTGRTYDPKRRKLNFSNQSDQDDKRKRTQSHYSTSRGNDFQVKEEEQEEFRKLDDSIPAEARRIQQRHRTILKGKNTVGYDEYLRQVPKERRKPRCPEHPQTPNHLLDIPNKRWLGLVKAWRIGLHQYDPKDLLNSSANSNNEDSKNKASEDKNVTKNKKQSIQEKQIDEATKKGLLVDFGSDDEDITSKKEGKAQPETPSSAIGSKQDEDNISGTFSIDDVRRTTPNTLRRLEDQDFDAMEGSHCDDFLDYEEDSDDDLL